MTETLMNLPYEHNALEPFFDEETMKIHHTKHHKGYVDKLNNILKGTGLENKPLTEILSNLENLPEKIKQKIINFGGGVYNHNFFWEILKKDVYPSGKILSAINVKFDCFEGFKEEFKQKAMTLFGSGWTWLVLNKEKELEIVQTKNQDSVISEGLIPLITLDVWEHAYYIKYKNKRDDFIDAFFEVINWDKVEELYSKAKE